MNRRVSCSMITAVLGVGASVSGQSTETQPVELGAVEWQREYQRGLERVQREGKPMLLLFQEVPGWAGCQAFGRGPLSHPLLVETMEDSFVPVAIYNNVEGRDRAILKQFNEPTWNYQVMRFIGADEQDILPRRDRVWSMHQVASRLVEALEAADADVPDHLRWVEAETAADDNPARSGTATFAMFWYWDGEARLGSIEGVVHTRSGWLDKLEVVEVQFDTTVVSYEKLLEQAIEKDCNTRVYAHSEAHLAHAKKQVGDRAVLLNEKASDAKPADQLFALKRSPHRYLPLTPMQATKVNAALRLGGDAARWLSPRQQALLKRIEHVLKRDASSLDALKPTHDVEKLAAYQAALLKLLTAVESQTSTAD